jgi:predicted transcriptional regulator
MTEVIAQMKENDISQVPALNPDGTLAGIVTEVDLLKHMLEAGHEHSHQESIAAIAQPAEAVFPVHASLEDALPSVMDGNVILITEGDHPVGILTKIDVLDFIAGKR